MKKTIITMMMLMAMALMTVPAQADVAYAPFLFTGNDAAGNPIVDGSYSLILDLDGDGWDGNSYTSMSLGAANDLNWLWDSDDLLLDRGQVSAGTAFPFTNTVSISTQGYDAGVDQWFLLWFDTPYDVSAAGPGSGVDYGVELMGVAGNDGDTLSPFAVGGSAVFQTLGTTVVPEPISALLALIGGGAMALRRRFFNGFGVAV